MGFNLTQQMNVTVTVNGCGLISMSDNNRSQMAQDIATCLVSAFSFQTSPSAKNSFFHIGTVAFSSSIAQAQAYRTRRIAYHPWGSGSFLASLWTWKYGCSNVKLLSFACMAGNCFHTQVDCKKTFLHSRNLCGGPRMLL